jgi:hypothetical protein
MTGSCNKWHVVLAAAFAAVACGKPDSCPPPNYSPGDKFKVTINSLRVGEIACAEMPLAPGDSFVVIASNYPVPDVTGRSRCYTYPATPDVPAFAEGVMTSCKPGDEQLGVQCEGVTAHGCMVTMSTGVGQVPSASQGVVNHTLFGFNTGGGQMVDGGEICSMSAECGLNQFDVTVERLAPGADAGG